MKMVSAAKYARAEKDLKAARPYGLGAQSFYEHAQVGPEEGAAPEGKTLYVAVASAAASTPPFARPSGTSCWRSPPVSWRTLASSASVTRRGHSCPGCSPSRSWPSAVKSADCHHSSEMRPKSPPTSSTLASTLTRERCTTTSSNQWCRIKPSRLPSTLPPRWRRPRT